MGNELGDAILHVLTYEKKYRLYARIYSPIFRDFVHSPADVPGFPVILTDAVDINGLQFEGLVEEPSVLETKLVETYRDPTGTLRLRFIEGV